MIRRMPFGLVVLLVLASPLWVIAADPLDPGLTYGTFVSDGREIGFYRQGGTLSASNYDWWYGCSPTAAGMMMGNYDRNGYDGLEYPNLVPGGVAEVETFVGPPTGWNALANNVVASQGHVSDFYVAGYLASGDDLPQPWHDFNCLADYMGTSQDSAANANGSTTFHYYTNGAPFHDYDALAHGVQDNDGMYGIGEYIEYAGYDTTSLFTQLIYPYNTNTLGFSLDDYKTEIDAGRPTLIHVEGHTMLGYGYDDAIPDTIYVYDTWAPNGQNPGSMTWAGAYSGRSHWGVTALTITGGVPEPATVILLAIGGLLFLKRRRI